MNSWSTKDQAGIHDRAQGALIGLAVGDALGTTLEFSIRDAQPHHAEMTGGGPFNLDPGTWTDDTSMALALADSLVAMQGFDADDLMSRFVRWWRHGEYSPVGACFDIGMTTRAVLQRYLDTGNPNSGCTQEDSAGNGSVMRLSPVALLTLHDKGECRRIAAAQSRTTHAAPQAVEGCVFFAEKLRRAILGETKEAVLAPETWDGHDAVRAIAAASWRGLPREKISATGYVIHTLEAACWAVEQTSTFEDALVLAVNLGDDADTVGAVTGQLAGAIYGYSSIPARWLEHLAWRSRLITVAEELMRNTPIYR